MDATTLIADAVQSFLRKQSETRILCDLLRAVGRQLTAVREHGQTTTLPQIWPEYIDALEGIARSRSNIQLLALVHKLKTMNQRNREIDLDWTNTAAVMDHFFRVRLNTLPELQDAISRAERAEMKRTWLQRTAIIVMVIIATALSVSIYEGLWPC